MKAPLITVAGLLFLTGCVGSDPQSAMHSGGGRSFASLPGQASTDLRSTAEPLRAGVMPGDLLIAPTGGRSGTNPRAILERTEPRPSDAPTRRASPAAVSARAPSYPVFGSANVGRVPAGTAGPTAASSPADTFASTGFSSTAATPTPGLRPIQKTGLGTSLVDVEAHAEAEQRLQNRRDQRFDTQVRRASSLVCAGCLAKAPSPARKPMGRVGPDRDAE